MANYLANESSGAKDGSGVAPAEAGETPADESAAIGAHRLDAAVAAFPVDKEADAAASGNFDTRDMNGLLAALSGAERAFEDKRPINGDGNIYHPFAVAVPPGSLGGSAGYAGLGHNPPRSFDREAHADITELTRDGDIAAWLDQTVQAQPDGTHTLTVSKPGLPGDDVRREWVIGHPKTAGTARKHFAYKPPQPEGGSGHGSLTHSSELLAIAAAEATPDGVATRHTFTNNPPITEQLAPHRAAGHVLLTVREIGSLPPGLDASATYFIDQISDDGNFHLINALGDDPAPLTEGDIAAYSSLHYTVVRPRPSDGA